MESKSYALVSGIFTLALLAVAVVVAIWFNRDTRTMVPYKISTNLSVPGLNSQASVRYRGIEVGKVTQLGFDPAHPGKILIQFSADAHAPITRSTYAMLAYQGVTGIAYIQLSDDGLDSDQLVSSAENMASIPLHPSLPDQLVENGSVVLKETKDAIRNFNDLLIPKNQKIIISAVENFGQASASFDRLQSELSPTLKKMPDIATQLQSNLAALDVLTKNLSALTVSLGEFSAGLNHPNSQIDQTIGALKNAGNSIHALSDHLDQQTLPRIESLSREIGGSLHQITRNLNTIAQHPQSLFRGLPITPPGPGEPGFDGR